MVTERGGTIPLDVGYLSRSALHERCGGLCAKLEGVESDTAQKLMQLTLSMADLQEETARDVDELQGRLTSALGGGDDSAVDSAGALSVTSSIAPPH